MQRNSLGPSRKQKTVFRTLMILLIPVCMFTPNKSPTGTAVLLVEVSILFAYFYVFRIVVRKRQRDLNSYVASAKLEPFSYFLYLRSFKYSGRTIIKTTFGDWSERSIVGQHWDLEYALSSLASIAPHTKRNFRRLPSLKQDARPGAIADRAEPAEARAEGAVPRASAAAARPAAADP
jgi:hypothetical protein